MRNYSLKLLYFNDLYFFKTATHPQKKPIQLHFSPFLTVLVAFFYKIDHIVVFLPNLL